MITINKRSILHYILIYLLIICQGSVFYKNNSDYFIIGTFVVFLIFAYTKGWKLKDKKYFYGLIFVFALLLLTFVLSGGSLALTSILNIISRFLMVYIVYYYDEGNFCDRFVKIISLLAAISLMFYTIQCISPSILTSLLPMYENSNQVYYGSFVFTYAPAQGTRNVGIFAEPGLYQIVLNAALFVMLFMKDQLDFKKNRRYLVLVILFVAVVTTQSTSGYISTILLVVFYLFKKDNGAEKRLKWLIIIAFTIFVIFDLSRGNNSLINQTVFQKLLDQEGGLDVTVSTGSARYYSMLADLAVAVKYPLGAGFTIYEKIWSSMLPVVIGDTSSCVGLTRSLATIGFPCTIFILGFYIWLINRNFEDLVMKIAWIAFFINVSLGQPSIQFTAIMVLMLINCKDKAKNSELAVEGEAGFNNENSLVD